MTRAEPFECQGGRREAWCPQHDAASVSARLALRPFAPSTGDGLEIGVGSGRVAALVGGLPVVAPVLSTA
jgi:hypothetical protein